MEGKLISTDLETINKVEQLESKVIDLENEVVDLGLLTYIQAQSLNKYHQENREIQWLILLLCISFLLVGASILIGAS